MEIIFIVGRILLGGYFLYSGYNHFANLDHLAGYAKSKNVPMAKEAVGFTGLMMLFGGATVLTGIGMTVGLIVLVVFLGVTSVMMHPFWKVTDPNARMTEQINFTKNLALAAYSVVTTISNLIILAMKM